jgi:predicted Zn-dependent protease with MMP-like domain
MTGETRDDDLLERIYDALDDGDPGTAADLARRALVEQQEDDPVLRLLWGVALLELDRPGEAAEHLARSVELDPDDAEAHANLALARFRSCRFAEAETAARRALELEPGLPDAHAVHALALERRGLFEEADRHEAKAADLDPERFPAPERIPRAEFEAEIVRAGARLPERFRKLLDEVAVLVEAVPPAPILFDEDPPLDPELLGLFVGVSLPERTHFDGPGGLPARILLFQRNLERHAGDLETLRSEIAITLYHELGHYLGLDEDGLDELDLA